MRNTFSFVLITVLALTALPARADSPSPAGLWETISDTDGKPRGLVRIEVTPAGEIRGIVAGSLRDDDPARLCERCSGARRNKPVIGMEILWGLKASRSKPLLWNSGNVVDPETGGQYSAQLTLAPDGDTISLRGFVGTPALGRTQTWRRRE
jgi:uncharacterized protein (DUF2147 family)